MKIYFCWDWRFKSKETQALALEYMKRIGHFAECAVSPLGALEKKRTACEIWLCDTSKDAKALTSEALSTAVQRLENSGKREWFIAVGGADGFSGEDKQRLKPDLLWNFGPLTLPHELAAVVAAEQVYRAYSILRKLPYHSGH